MPKKTDPPAETRGKVAKAKAAGTTPEEHPKAAAKASVGGREVGPDKAGMAPKAKAPVSKTAPAKGGGETPKQTRTKVASTEEKAEKPVAKKSTLGKIAKAVTDQVSALAKKVSGGGKSAAPKEKGAKAAPPSSGGPVKVEATDLPAKAAAPVKSEKPAQAAKSSMMEGNGKKVASPALAAPPAAPVERKAPAVKAPSAPVPATASTSISSEASVKPASTSPSKAETSSPAPDESPNAGVGKGRAAAAKGEPSEASPKVSASRGAVAKAVSGKEDKKPVPEKPLKQAGVASTPGAAAALESLTGGGRGESDAVGGAAGKGKQAPGKSRKAAGTEAASDIEAEDLIRAEEEIPTAPAPSDVREQIFHDRYAHIPSPPPRELPQEYGDTRIMLLVRDPEWIYAYWEVNDATRQELRLPRSGHNRRMVIRLYKITDRNWPEEAAHYFLDVEVSPYAHNWYMKVPETAQRWCAELGMFDEEGEYFPIVRSNVIATPRDTVSPKADADWMTVEEVYQTLYGMSTGYAAANAVLHGAAGRGASEQLMRHLQRQIAVGLRGGQDLSSGALYSGSSESVSASRPLATKDFWLQVHTELILYGSTEPDATVMVQGRPVKLNPDGTFSLRYALPDGEQVLQVRATNRDGDMEREVTPVVTRTTRKD